ncbi:MAG: adenosine kinase [Mariprofundaceae bacterium]|nr:adenosine kinase [Mariprofundaceae bacterium]
MNINVYGVGNAIMDLQVQCDDAFLQQHAIEKGIMSLTQAEEQQRILQALSSQEVNYCSGGSAANTMVAIAAMGGSAAYAGKVAEDDFGQQYAADFQALGIHFAASNHAGDTGTCVVLITPDAQRTMLTNLGVSATLSVADIDEQRIQQAEYVYIEGYLFAGETSKAAALHAITLAKKHHTKVALTISDPFLIDICRDDFQKLIENDVDLLFCNEAEALALTGKSAALDAAQDIHQHGVNVALTLGEKGSIIIHEGEVISVAGVQVQAVDTTGAGDMYAAGVLYGITNGLTWTESGQKASAAAAKIVAQLGARLAP